MKPHEFEALVRTKALVVKQAPEPVVESSPAPVLEAMDIDSLDHQYQTMLDEGWFDNQTSDAENDAKVAGRRNFLKAVGTGLAGAGLAAAGLGASQNAQAGNAPEIKMQDARHGTVAYQGKNIPITLNDTTRAMGTLAKAKLNGQTVDIRIGLDGARAWIPPSAMPHMGESMMAGGTEAYTMEDEQLDGMALGELQAIVQAAKKIFASVKQGVPLEAWMYKKITNGNEGLTAVAQQINNPAVREQPGVAEGSLEELANTSLKVKEPKDMYNVNDRKQTTYKLFKFKSGKNTFLINFTVKSPPTYGKKQNWNAVNVAFGVKEKQDDYGFGDEMNTDLTGRNKNQFLIYSTVINTIRRFITEYNTEIDEIIMQGAGERQEAMYQRFFQSAGKYFPGWHYDGKHSLVRDVPRQKVKKVREQGVAEGKNYESS